MKSFAIIGMGRFGSALATSLYELGHDVLAVDKNEELIQAISGRVTHAVSADANDEDILKSLGIRNFDAVIVAIASDMQSSILITVLLREIGVKHIVAKAQSEIHAKILEKVGADKIVFPEKDTAVRFAHSITISNMLNYIGISPQFSIVEMLVPEKWAGKSLAELQLRFKYGINVIAIKPDESNKINTAPQADTVLLEGQILVVSCTEEAITLINKIK